MMKIFTCILLAVFFSTATMAASINLDVSTLNFGSITPSDSPQMLTTPINITWDATNFNNWKMRIYTDNTGLIATSPNPLYTGSKDASGLVGVTYRDRTIGLKVWCANYGPGTTPPDVSNSTYWSDNWFYIFDYANIGTRERVLMRTGTELANPFAIYLASLFSSSAEAQAYQTSTLTIELIEQ